MSPQRILGTNKNNLLEQGDCLVSQRGRDAWSSWIADNVLYMLQTQSLLRPQMLLLHFDKFYTGIFHPNCAVVYTRAVLVSCFVWNHKNWLRQILLLFNYTEEWLLVVLYCTMRKLKHGWHARKTMHLRRWKMCLITSTGGDMSQFLTGWIHLCAQGKTGCCNCSLRNTLYAKKHS